MARRAHAPPEEGVGGGNLAAPVGEVARKGRRGPKTPQSRQEQRDSSPARGAKAPSWGANLIDECGNVCYNTLMKQIVAFDIGDRRVGVAFSDPFGEYAIPSDTYFRTGDLQRDVAALISIAKSRGAQLIVCGLPLNADGTESDQTRKTRRVLGKRKRAERRLVDHRTTLLIHLL